MSERVLVAGAGGFSGGHLVADLLRQGREVRAVDLKPFDQWYQLFPTAENLQPDLRDEANCKKAARDITHYNLAAPKGVTAATATILLFSGSTTGSHLPNCVSAWSKPFAGYTTRWRHDRAPLSHCNFNYRMRLLISGICGFAGSEIATGLLETKQDIELIGFDNLSRPGSELNRPRLQKLGVRLLHADARSATDMETLPPVDWVIDAAANPSVLAGFGDGSNSRQIIEHNLIGTINLLEYCKRCQAGMVLLSTSRVYSVAELSRIEVEEVSQAYRPVAGQNFPTGVTTQGISEDCSTVPPISLYGSTKLASEVLALEYGSDFDFPVWVNRCGVLAGAGQFGRGDQGIFSFWINSWLRHQTLSYFGFVGLQVRDCLHPRDLVPLLVQQMDSSAQKSSICNVSGGLENSMSLAQLSQWCNDRFGARGISTVKEPTRFDLPWLVLDASRAKAQWQWHPITPLTNILQEIADHAQAHPNWLEIAGANQA